MTVPGESYDGVGSDPIGKPPLVSVMAFLAILWTGFTLCALAFAGRVYVRISVFKKMLIDDWLMLFALVLMCGVSVISQLVLEYVYAMRAVGSGEVMPGPTYLEEMQMGMRGFGVAGILWWVGIWTVKLNFLIFFYRLGSQITGYRIFWWIVLVFTVGCAATSIALMQFKCMFGDVMSDIVPTCNTSAPWHETYLRFQIGVILDCVSDVLIICFPVSILWRVRISLRKKLMLAGIFGLVAFTIAVTFVRGAIFGADTRNSEGKTEKVMNVSWIWFWFSIQFIVAYLIACLVSFRALFAQQEHSDREAEAREYRVRKVREDMEKRQRQVGVDPPNKRESFWGRMLAMHESLRETCHTLEGMTATGNHGGPRQSNEILTGRFDIALPGMTVDSERGTLHYNKTSLQKETTGVAVWRNLNGSDTDPAGDSTITLQPIIIGEAR